MEAEDRGSLTTWIDALRTRDQEAARSLWRRYFEFLRNAWLDEALP